MNARKTPSRFTWKSEHTSMKLDKNIYRCAIQHISDFGDTDVFPYPFELRFVEACADDVSEKLSNTDLVQYNPMSLIESLIPKTKFGFRLAHQPYPVDTVIFTALILKIYDAVEVGRDDIGNNRAFSYRKAPGLNHELFVPDHTYREWLGVPRRPAIFHQFQSCDSHRHIRLLFANLPSPP